MIEEFCRVTQGWRLVDGFTNDPRAAEYFWSRTAFDSFNMNQGEKVIVLFKLHGSTTWICLGSRIVKSPPVYSEADSSFPNIIIYPATRKVAIEDLFFTAYDYLEKGLSRATFCLVVGYSFRDYDSLMRFKTAKLANPQLRIVVLDSRAHDLSEGLKEQGVGVEPLPFLFDLQEAEYVPRIGELLK
jgi:hypothetical protein